MNMGHLNFVVEARYYGYWIALVFAIICLLMFVYVKILDARKQKERLNAESKKIHNDTIFTKELVRKLSGFFMHENDCRGYDPNTPIGEIARHAFLHWREFEKYRLDCKEKAEHIAELQKQVHDYVQGLYEIQARAENEIRHQKYKRCLDNAWWILREEFHAEDCHCERWVNWAIRWYKRWLELANKFKEDK